MKTIKCIGLFFVVSLVGCVPNGNKRDSEILRITIINHQVVVASGEISDTLKNNEYSTVITLPSCKIYEDESCNNFTRLGVEIVFNNEKRNLLINSTVKNLISLNVESDGLSQKIGGKSKDEKASQFTKVWDENVSESFEIYKNLTLQINKEKI